MKISKYKVREPDGRTKLVKVYIPESPEDAEKVKAMEAAGKITPSSMTGIVK